VEKGLILLPDKNRTIVRIAGREYSLISNDSDEYMQKVALFVNKRMAETYKYNNKLSTMMIAVLASLNIADELLKKEDHINDLNNQLKASIDELNRLKSENEEIKRVNKSITDYDENIKLELARKQAEIETIRNDLIVNRERR
jgi:cell division protein ZapA